MKLQSSKYYDELMLEFIKSKNKKVFYKIVEDWKDILLNFFYNNLNNLETSEELTQDVFINLWKLEKYNAQGMFSAWILKIAKNKLIDYSRKNKLATYSFDEHPYLIESEYNDLLEQNVIEKNESEIIRKIIYDMPEEQRIILTLSHIEDMPYKDIAEITGYSINSVKGKVFRAINKFVDKFKELNYV